MIRMMSSFLFTTKYTRLDDGDGSGGGIKLATFNERCIAIQCYPFTGVALCFSVI